MTKVFLSPSSQTANLVHGGGHEQQYARARCARAAEVLREHGVTVKVSSIMDDSAGGADLHERWPIHRQSETPPPLPE